MGSLVQFECWFYFCAFSNKTLHWEKKNKSWFHLLYEDNFMVHVVSFSTVSLLLKRFVMRVMWLKKTILPKYSLFRNVVVSTEFDFNVGMSTSTSRSFDMPFRVILLLRTGHNILIVSSVYFYELSMAVDIAF